jgi:16S rRNA (guanine966-N2)-methyltransferase
MRVIGGSAKGRHLKGPRGPGTRPTSDLVRGAIFDVLRSMGADFSRVLDLYAGTGALGIEALSRGADWCDFVERGRRSCETIRENLEHTDLAARAAVRTLSARQVPERLQGPYTLVLADPPYDDERALEDLGRVAASSLLAPGAVLVLEHSRRREAPPVLGGRPLLQTRRHGDTCVSFYR